MSKTKNVAYWCLPSPWVLKNNGYGIPVCIHLTAYISPDAENAEGCFIRAKCVASRYVKLGETAILNVSALLDCHVEIGAGRHIIRGGCGQKYDVNIPAYMSLPSGD